MKNWKRAEQRLATQFATTRRPLSGGNSKTGRDDGFHDVIFLESKHARRHAIWSLYKKTKAIAKEEDRIPVIGLHQSHETGVLFVIHSSEFKTVALEYLKAQGYILSPKKIPKPLRKGL